MQKILITGGLGYIGSHIAAELISRGMEVVLVDNLANTDEGVAEKISQIAGKEIKYYIEDICNEAGLSEIFEKEKPDAAVHCAALKAVGESVQKPIEYYRNNIGGTACLLSCMQKYGVKKCVFASSACVYGTPKSSPYDETFELHAENPYGETKIACEQLLGDVCKTDPDFTTIIFRYANPIGAHASGLIGENPVGIPNNVAPYILQVAAGKREIFTIFGGDYETADKTPVREYLHVVDLAAAHGMALEKIKTRGGHVYNLGTGVGTSVKELLSAFERAAGKPIPHQIGPRRAGDIACYFGTSEKARKDFGWKAVLSVDEMCRSGWNFISKQGN